MATHHIPPPNDPIWQRYAKEYPIIGHMLKNGDPLTRERWLTLNYMPDDVPEHIPGEIEDLMPPPFRRAED